MLATRARLSGLTLLATASFFHCSTFKTSNNRTVTDNFDSETEFSLDPSKTFQPNVFVDISPYLEKKLDLLRIYASELGEFPFPRSEKAIRALVQFRGSSSGFENAEGFELLLERNSKV